MWPTSTMLPDAQEALMEQIAMLIGSDAEQVARNAFASVDWMLPVIANLATWLIYVVVFALMYHYLPDRSVSWKHAVGVGSALFVLGRTAIGWYLDRAEPESAYGYMGALILALLWIYYSALVVFLGALITAVVDERRKARKAERNSATNTRATRTSRRCALAAPSALSDVALRRCFASWIGQDNAGRGNEYDFKRHDAAIVQLHLGAQCISAGFWARGR